MHNDNSPESYFDPQRKRVLMVWWKKFPSIKRMSNPYLKLAGVRFDPITRKKRGGRGDYGINKCAQKMSLFDLETKQDVLIGLPKDTCSDQFKWSADGAHFAFQNTTDSQVNLWTYNVSKNKLKQLKKIRINTILSNGFRWMPDQKHLLVKMVPKSNTETFSTQNSPIAPTILVADGNKGKSSTYETRDVLKNPKDEDMFEYYGTSQLGVVNIKSGKLRLIGAPSVFSSLSVSPNGQFILTKAIERPYSYVTTYVNFAQSINIYDQKSNTYHVTRLTKAERIPIRGVRQGPRRFRWAPTQKPTLLYTEALDKGDLQIKVSHRDQINTLSFPFELKSSKKLTKTKQRSWGFDWTDNPNLSFLWEYNQNKQWIDIYKINIQDPAKKELMWSRSSREKYNHPGRFVKEIQPNGWRFIKTEGDFIFFKGSGATKDGNRPFLDKFNINTKETNRLFRSNKNELEYFYRFYPDNTQKFYTWHQSRTSVPNIKLRTLTNPVSSIQEGESAFESNLSVVTSIKDTAPQIRDIKTQLIRYKRKDNLDLSMKLFLPPGYQEGDKVPTVLISYPVDFASRESAGQVSTSPNTFLRLRGIKLLLLSGYAIADATFPIVGDPLKAYDTYIEQLIDNAQAAVDILLKKGITTKNQIGVTGHSHGGLMTANLIAHTNLFRAGMANAGSYNKTFTPFGFQNERRTVWENLDGYIRASPFFMAHKMKAPLLIMHGLDDANPGTTPLQSRKLFEAIRGNGGISKLVLFPHEPHWFSAKESNEHFAYEQLKWFDKYLKGPSSPE